MQNSGFLFKDLHVIGMGYFSLIFVDFWGTTPSRLTAFSSSSLSNHETGFAALFLCTSVKPTTFVPFISQLTYMELSRAFPILGVYTAIFSI